MKSKKTKKRISLHFPQQQSEVIFQSFQISVKNIYIVDIK